MSPNTLLKRSSSSSSSQRHRDVDNALADQYLQEHTQHVPSDGHVLYINEQSFCQPQSFQRSRRRPWEVVTASELKMEHTTAQSIDGNDQEEETTEENREETTEETTEEEEEEAKREQHIELDPNDNTQLPTNLEELHLNNPTTTTATTTGTETVSSILTTTAPSITGNHSVKSNFVRICAISDTHQRHRAVTESIPVCDVLIHTGDIFYLGRRRTRENSLEILRDFNDWLESLPAKHIVVIGGNHDFILDGMSSEEVNKEIFPSSKIHYLCCDYVDLEGYRFIGIPTSQGKSRNKAFQSMSFHTRASEYVKSIGKPAVSNHATSAPFTRRILLTHSLQDRYILETLRPDIHFWGHAHSYYGLEYSSTRHPLNPKAHTYWSICSCIMDGRYQTRNRPIVVDVPV